MKNFIIALSLLSSLSLFAQNTRCGANVNGSTCGMGVCDEGKVWTCHIDQSGRDGGGLGNDSVGFQCMPPAAVSTVADVEAGAPGAVHVLADGSACPLNPPTEIEINIGFNDGIYVCEIGFDEHLCRQDGRNPKGDHIVVNNGLLKEVITIGSGPKTFTPEEAKLSGIAKVYLNSSNYGASYYVKYCYDYTREVLEGTEIPMIGEFYGNAYMNIADDGGYFQDAGVSSKFSYACGKSGIEEIPLVLDSNSSVEVPFAHLFDMTGVLTAVLADGCSFRFDFTESKRDVIRKPLNGDTGAAATVYTTLEYWMDFIY